MIFNVAQNAKTLGCTKYGFLKVWFWGKDGEGVLPRIDYTGRLRPKLGFNSFFRIEAYQRVGLFTYLKGPFKIF